MEKIEPKKLIVLDNGEQYIIGAAEVTRYDKKDGKQHHFCLAIACGTSDLSQVKIDESEQKKIRYTVVEWWEQYNPNTGEMGVKVCENESDRTVVRELLGLSSGNEDTPMAPDTAP